MNKQDDKWIPEVGRECEVLDKHKGKWNKVKITAIGEDYMLVKWSSAETILSKSCDLRPLQTQADKVREEQLEKLSSAVAVINSDSQNPFEYIEDAYDLYNAGVRVLGPDERICKPLSDEKVNILTLDTMLPAPYAKKLVQAVQRELGLIEGDEHVS